MEDKSAMEKAAEETPSLRQRRNLEGKISDALDTLAKQNAAITWSTVGDRVEREITEEHGDINIFAIAEFGFERAINGDPLGPEESISIPNECELTGKGGRVPTTENEVSVDTLARKVHRETGVPIDDVFDSINKMFPGTRGVLHSTSSGRTSIYACPPNVKTLIEE